MLSIPLLAALGEISGEMTVIIAIGKEMIPGFLTEGRSILWDIAIVIFIYFRGRFILLSELHGMYFTVNSKRIFLLHLLFTSF